jgi:hypothetical protein
MKAVVDPGVLVSALIAPKGTPAQLLDLLIQGRFEVIVSQRLLGELIGVLLEPGSGLTPASTRYAGSSTSWPRSRPWPKTRQSLHGSPAIQATTTSSPWQLTLGPRCLSLAIAI